MRYPWWWFELQPGWVDPHWPVLAIIGGLHLFAATGEQVDWTGDKLKRFGLGYLVGAHCTAIESLYRLRTRIGLTRQTAVVAAAGAGFTPGKGIDPLRAAQSASGSWPRWNVWAVGHDAVMAGRTR